MSEIILDGVAIAGYRSFGDKLQRIGPLKKLNLIIGKNNSGKSNILRFLNKHYKGLIQAIKNEQPVKNPQFEDLDVHRGTSSNKIQFGYAIDLKGGNYLKLKNLLIDRLNKNRQGENIFNTLLNSKPSTSGSDIAWFLYSADSYDSVFKISPALISSIQGGNILSREQWQILSNALTGVETADIDLNINAVLPKISPINLDPPNIYLIPAFRQVGEKGPSPADNDFSGSGLIEKLARLQHPPLNQQHLKLQFEQINQFLRNVIENKSANLEIPNERDMIIVHIDEKSLPISSLGTGIHQVILMAAAATVLDKTVLCIEEPEIHLHPTLQKKLIRYLNENTTNQYLITTHSAHLLDTQDAAIFHIRYEDGQSIVEPAIQSSEKFLICEDLGYRASDLLQSNCIIWVEGPSDRLYIRHWLNAINNDLIEGVHYSIMFYGGKLLSHLSVDDEDFKRFINLLSINRKSSIVIDSVRDEPEAELNQTKQRIIQEFNKGPGFAWVTGGKTIENYIEPSFLEKSVCGVHPGASSLVSKERYSNVLEYKKRDTSDTSKADKIKLAHKVVESPANLGVLDLHELINKLNKFILISNGLDKK